MLYPTAVGPYALRKTKIVLACMHKRLKIKKKGSFLKNRFFLFGVAVVVCTELLFYGIVLFPFFQIQEMRIEGNEEVLGSKIKSIVFERLWGEFLFFPTASIFLVDAQSMRDVLLETVPELETVSIQRKLPNILTVAVQERKVVALWCPAPELPGATRCRATLNRIADGDSGLGCQELRCVAIDSNGVAFKEADPSFESIKIYGQGQSLSMNEAVVAKNVLDVILDFAKEATRRSLFLQGELSFEIVSENQIHAHTGEGWSVYFTHTHDLSWQITKLQTVLENKIPPEKRRKLEYIDVRFGDQAYLQYR